MLQSTPDQLGERRVTKQVLLAEPRGFCAGVERAVAAVLRALDAYGLPVYVRKHIVHNMHVVADLEARGAIFVESEPQVPEGARLVLAAHGVEPRGVTISTLAAASTEDVHFKLPSGLATVTDHRR
jgi:4-hydroxy-3-methylbut-2-enyl diphosphate reductase